MTGISLDPEIQIRHVQNFLDCVKSRQKPVADVETGHRSIVPCHLANVACRVGAGATLVLGRPGELLAHPHADETVLTAVQEALRRIDDACKSGANMVPATLEAVKAFATVGEIVERWRQHFGVFSPSTDF